MKQEVLISLLNPMIRGWANYHRHVVAKKTYSVVDHHIWQALRRWARRRHPRKSSAWVRRKYFRTLDKRQWVFATETRKYTGEPRTLTLYSASDTRIVRWTIQPAIPFKARGTRSLTNLKLLHSSCLRPFRIANGHLSADDNPVPAP